MLRHVLAFTLLAVACGSHGAPSQGSSDPSGQPTGTPASMLESAQADDGAGSGSGSGSSVAVGVAFVQASFDAKAAAVVQAKCKGNKLRLTLDGVLFDFDHDNLQPGGDDVLAQVKKVAVDPYPKAHIDVEGHTDDVGTDAHNNDLSLRRARTVASWMQAHAVDAARLQATGYGKRWPRVPNTSDANRAKNRRVEFVVTDDTAGASCSSRSPRAERPPRDGDGVLAGGAPGGGEGGPLVPSGGHDQADSKGSDYTAFSYKWNDTNIDKGYTCFTWDPKWIPPDAPKMAFDKGEYDTLHGRFLDKCPTDNVIASCDHRPKVPQVEWYYAGMGEGAIGIRKVSCGGKWTRVGEAVNSKMPADTGTYAVVCDTHTSKDLRCVEIRPDGNPTYITAYQQMCRGQAQPPRCPPGANGRCDQQGMITYYYEPPAGMVSYQNICEHTGGTWSQP